MARKLKSDQVLFLATTLLLVCLSIVMVYSASAVVAMERFSQPYLFLIKQAMWAALGLARARHRDAHRLPHLPAADRSSGRCSASSRWRCVARAVQARRSTARAAGSRSAGLGMQPSELAKLAAILFTAALLERRMHRINELGYSLLPIGVVVGGLVGADPARARLRHRDVAAADRRGVMVFAAGLNYRYLVGAAAAARCRRSTSS